MGVAVRRGPCHSDVVHAFNTAIRNSPDVDAHTNGGVVAHSPRRSNSLNATVSRTMRLTAAAPNYGCALNSILGRITLRRAVVNLRTRGRVRVTNRCPSGIVTYFNNNDGFNKLTFPFVHRGLGNRGRARFVTTRPRDYPGLAHKGFRCSFNSRTKCAPLLPVFALNRSFGPTGVRTNNLHCRNTNVVVSRLIGSNCVRNMSMTRARTFRTNVLFTHMRNVVPTPRDYRTVTTAVHRTGGTARRNGGAIVLFYLSNRNLVSVPSCRDCLGKSLRSCEIDSRRVGGFLRAMPRMSWELGEGGGTDLRRYGLTFIFVLRTALQ